MKEIKAKEGHFLTPKSGNGERIYVTAITGANVNESDWRDASAEEQEAYTDLEGCNSYDEVLEMEQQMKNDVAKVTRKINYIGLTDNEALSVKELYPRWEEKVDMTIEAGYITLYNDTLWRARQTHTALAIYPPSMDTAALYEVVDYKHEGTESDPIPYTPPMEIFADKYYIQNDVLYKCTRDSQTALSHNLADLVGLYVVVA